MHQEVGTVKGQCKNNVASVRGGAKENQTQPANQSGRLTGKMCQTLSFRWTMMAMHAVNGFEADCLHDHRWLKQHLAKITISFFPKGKRYIETHRLHATLMTAQWFFQ
jgi:hypothetical protein